MRAAIRHVRFAPNSDRKSGHSMVDRRGLPTQVRSGVRHYKTSSRPTKQNPKRISVSCVWPAHCGARFSIRKVQQIRAASATTKCSVASESDEENRAALACPLSVCLAGNSRVLRNVAETMKDYANEVARHPQRVDVGAYLRCRVYRSSGTARRIACPRGSHAH
jgi:hypothetical protein